MWPRVSGGRKQLQELRVLTGGNSSRVRPILLGRRPVSVAHRKVTCVKLPIVWTEFRIVLQGDLFLKSSKEHTHFPSIRWGPHAGRGGSRVAWGWAMWDSGGAGGVRGVLLGPKLSQTLPGKKEEVGQARGGVSACKRGFQAGPCPLDLERMGSHREKGQEEPNSGPA